MRHLEVYEHGDYKSDVAVSSAYICEGGPANGAELVILIDENGVDHNQSLAGYVDVEHHGPDDAVYYKSFEALVRRN